MWIPLWTRWRRRSRCSHDWEFVRREEVPDSEGGFPPGGLMTRMRPVYVYRCSKCGKKKREHEEPEQGAPW